MTRTTVYRLYSVEDEPLYVGCSTQGIKRLLQHEGRDWFNEVGYAWFDHYENHQEALSVERSLIEKLRPKYNNRYKVPVDGRPPDLMKDPERAA